MLGLCDAMGLLCAVLSLWSEREEKERKKGEPTTGAAKRMRKIARGHFEPARLRPEQGGFWEVRLGTDIASDGP